MSDSQVAAMRAELQELHDEVARLRSEVSSFRHKPGTSMRHRNLCPMCGARSFLHASEIRDGSVHRPMALQIDGTLKYTQTEIGVFQVYICRSCEFAEWYVAGAGDIDPEKLDKKNRQKVRIIDGQPPKDGVFR